MNTFEVMGPPGVPQTIPVMYVGAPGQAADFGAVRWSRSRRIPAKIRIRRGGAVSPRRRIRRRPTRRPTSRRVVRTPQRRTRRRPTRQPVSGRAVISPQTRRAIIEAARREAAARSASPRSYQSAFRRAGMAVPAGMKERIDRLNIERAFRKAELAARRKAEAEKRAKMMATLHPIFTTKAPGPKAGIQEWEEYHRITGMTFLPGHRTKIEYMEKRAFARATGARYYVSRELRRAAGGRTGTGVMWMFALAYHGHTMPYWDLWYYRKRTADEIARMVAADWTKEFARRVQLKEKYIQERESWQDAGRPGPAPRIDPREGLDRPITPARVYG